MEGWEWGKKCSRKVILESCYFYWPQIFKIRLGEGKNAVQRKKNEPNSISSELHKHKGERRKKEGE